MKEAGEARKKFNRGKVISTNKIVKRNNFKFNLITPNTTVLTVNK